MGLSGRPNGLAHRFALRLSVLFGWWQNLAGLLVSTPGLNAGSSPFSVFSFDCH